MTPYIQDLRLYWTSRRAIFWFGFRIRRFFYNWKERISTGGETSSIFLSLVVNIWRMVLVSLVLVTLLQLVDYYFHKYLLEILGFFPQWLTQVIQSLLEFVRLDKDTISQFLSTVAGVAGVFLGLYFTAISVVAGAMFVNVPGVVREQLVREKAGVVYVKGLALLTSTSILLLGYQTIGGSPCILNLLMIMGLCFFVVLSFLLLGTRVFHFFDYEKLARPIFADLQHDIRQATTRGFAWNDENFQAHYQKSAAQHVDALQVFVQTILSKENEEEPLVNLIRRMAYLFSEYEIEKRRIPTNSKWYEPTPIHQNWFLAESTSLTVAMNTYVGIQPKLQPNLFWLEEKLCQNMKIALSNALNKGRAQTAYRMFEPLEVVLKTCGREFAFEEASKIISMMAKEIVTYTHGLDKEIANRIQSNDYNLGLIDYYGYSILSFVLGFFDGVRKNELSLIQRRLRNISWTNQEQIYSKDFACSMLSRLEFVQHTTRFEEKVEGRSISPEWYLEQLVVMQYVYLISQGLRKVTEILRTEFVDAAKNFSDKGQFVFTAIHVQRGLELCEKIRFNVNQSKELIESFETVRIIHELPWPDWQWDKLYGDLKLIRENLVETIATCLPVLALIDRPKDAPDMFGQAYNSVYEHVIFLVERNRADEFSRMFPPLFIGAMLAYDRLQKEEDIMKASAESKLVFGTEPIIDMLDLSGYVKVYSELYLNSKMWDTCVKTWDKYLDSHQDATKIVKFLVAIVTYRESLYSMIPRDVLRTNWQIRLNNTLREENLVNDFGRRSYYGDDSPLEHRSPFIRAFCGHRHEPFISAVEIFILVYLLKRKEANGVEFRDNHDFLERLLKESYRQNSQGKMEENRG